MKPAILVQGPMSEKSDSVKEIDNYKKYGNVYLSCYTNNDIDFLADKDIQIITNDLPPLPSIPRLLDPKPGFTFYYALYSTYQGLINIKEEYTLKIRSDECYHNLEPFTEQITKNPNKLICGNIFYKPFRTGYKFHFGDHIFLCKTKILKAAYEKILNAYDDKRRPLDPAYDTYRSYGSSGSYKPEAVLCKAILREIDPTRPLTEKEF